jgi:hypothetical protein
MEGPNANVGTYPGAEKRCRAVLAASKLRKRIFGVDSTHECGQTARAELLHKAALRSNNQGGKANFTYRQTGS